MPIYETTTHIGPDGTLIIRMPPGFEDVDVRVVVERTRTNGMPGPVTPAADRAEALRQLAGSIDDPSFERPPQGDYPGRESLD